ncbi:MAG: HAMP domain-containing histidine kinase [Oscillospiraceae bacterium]|jgi:signal transduction histidine kinase|nr:HAMP domain-containing histidine kinase [Oscillospiraceae bacterium]
MLVEKKQIVELSENVRKIIDGQKIDIRDNKEGKLSILKNDIHTLANRLTEQAENSEKEKEALRQILSDISHQIKTPLTSMQIMVDLLPDAPPQKQEEFIANIKTSLTRTQWLVSALLKLARLDSGAVEFEQNTVTVAQLAEEALKPLQVLLDVKNQSVEIKGGSVQLLCDKRWTSEALTNIIKNASEYSPQGGKIVIEAGQNPLFASISVTDSGKGLTSAEQATIFRRFEGSRSEFGTGIGLPLALAIMRGQNGDIEAENTPHGAKFTVKFYSAQSN